MVGLSKPTKTEQHSSVNNPCKATTFFSGIPTIDLKIPEAKSLIVKACEDFGFFKLTNHGVPMEAISELESQALNFFSLPLTLKQKAGPPNPLGYGNKHIGRNGDVGWIEYLLLTTNPDYNSLSLSPVLGTNPEEFPRALNNYMSYVRKIACEVLELLAEGLKIQPRNVWSKMVMNKQSDSIFRLNHYPPCPELFAGSSNNAGNNVVGFGEHTDLQIISVLRSNDVSGLQICLKDGTWVSVPPDQSSFFINVGDSLQVMTNGRLKSAKHRVMANGMKSRVSMIYFCAPPLSERIAPLPSLIKQQSLYKEFTWFEYKKSAYATRLSDNRLALFEK